MIVKLKLVDTQDSLAAGFAPSEREEKSCESNLNYAKLFLTCLGGGTGRHLG